MLSARSTEQLRETEEALRATGAEVAAHAADVGSPDDAARLIEVTAATYGGMTSWSTMSAAVAVARAYLEAEHAGLPGKYARPEGVVLIAWTADEAVGIVAYRPLERGICE